MHGIHRLSLRSTRSCIFFVDIFASQIQVTIQAVLQPQHF